MSEVRRVVVVAGGLSPERDVSIRSGRRVAEEFRDAGWEADVVDVDSRLWHTLTHGAPDCVVPLVHGTTGEDGSLQQILELLGIPFVGSPTAACRLAFDKALAGEHLAAVGARVPRSITLPQSIFRDLGADGLLESIVESIGLPLVVQPNRGGSSLGVSIVNEASDLPSAMVAAFAYGDLVMIQQFVRGTEVSVAVVERDGNVVALPAVEIVPDSGLYDYTARYTAGTTEFFTPARVPTSHRQAVEQLAITAHRNLGLRDWSRTDAIIDESGEPWFLEVNVAPGMTETSTFPLAVVENDQSMREVLVTLATAASQRR